MILQLNKLNSIFLWWQHLRIMQLVLLSHHYEYKFSSYQKIVEAMAHGELILKECQWASIYSLRVTNHCGATAGGKGCDNSIGDGQGKPLLMYTHHLPSLKCCPLELVYELTALTSAICVPGYCDELQRTSTITAQRPFKVHILLVLQIVIESLILNLCWCQLI